MGRWPLHLRAGGRALLASADLGYLLRRCARVLVRDGEVAIALEADQLIAWRTLQIVIGAPCLPEVRALRAMYPGLRVTQGRIALAKAGPTSRVTSAPTANENATEMPT